MRRTPVRRGFMCDGTGPGAEGPRGACAPKVKVAMANTRVTKPTARVAWWRRRSARWRSSAASALLSGKLTSLAAPLAFARLPALTMGAEGDGESARAVGLSFHTSTLRFFSALPADFGAEAARSRLEAGATAR